MPYIPNSTSNAGLYIPLSNVWDVTRINQIPVNSPDFKQLIVSLYQNINNVVLSLNRKDSGLHDVTEFITGAQWFNPDPSRIGQPRTEYRKVINFGALGVATKSVAHGIACTTTTQFVHIYAVASKKTVAFSYLPIPYASVVAVANNIEISVDATNVTIANGIDRSAYDTCTVVLEYLLS